MEEKVMIGDYLGTIEEFMPGKGTYSEDGKIYAAKIGFKAVDPAKHVAEVHGKDLPSLDVGQTVFGEVMTLKSSVATVIVGKIQGQKGVIDERTTIYVSNISDKYVDKPENEFAVGDIVKAQVLKMDDNVIDLSTKGDEYGVVKAFCKRCRHPMEKSEKHKGKLECPNCSSVETRKISGDYGNVGEF